MIRRNVRSLRDTRSHGSLLSINHGNRNVPLCQWGLAAHISSAAASEAEREKKLYHLLRTFLIIGRPYFIGRIPSRNCWFVEMWIPPQPPLSCCVCLDVRVTGNALCANMLHHSCSFRWSCWINSQWKEAKKTQSAGSFHSSQVMGLNSVPSTQIHTDTCWLFVINKNDKNLLISASFPFIRIPFGILMTTSWANQASWRSSLVSWFLSCPVWLIRNICLRCVKMWTTTQWIIRKNQNILLEELTRKICSLRGTGHNHCVFVVIRSSTFRQLTFNIKKKAPNYTTMMSWRLGSAAPSSWLNHQLV